MAVLALAGLSDSIYLSYTALTNTALSCSITGLDGCNIVAKSVYSHFLGVPLGLYGVIFYLLILATIVMLYSVPSILVRQALILFTMVGFLMSIGFMALQVLVIHAVCVYCAASFIIALGLWILSLRVPKSLLATQL